MKKFFTTGALLATIVGMLLFISPAAAFLTACLRIDKNDPTKAATCERQYISSACFETKDVLYVEYDSMDACEMEKPAIEAGWCGDTKSSGIVLCYNKILDPGKCDPKSYITYFKSLADCLQSTLGNKVIIETLKQEKERQEKVTSLIKDLQVKKPLLEINLPELNLTEVKNTLDEDGNIHLPWIGQYVSALYKFGMVAASIIAVVMLILQGARIITSGGGEAKMAAYKRVAQIIIGLFLVWGSYFILYNINPDLVNFKALKVKYIEPIPLPEDQDNIEPDNYPTVPSVTKPTWDYKSFDCNKKDSYPPMGVIPESAVVKVSCPGIVGDNVRVIPEMKDPLCKMGALAKEAGYEIWVANGGSYRSFKQQKDGWCNDLEKLHKNDPLETKKYRAVPGFSNHGHGRAIDAVLAKDKNALFKVSSKTQCQVAPEIIAQLANFFYKADANFVRYNGEIWHFEYGTATTYPERSQTTVKPPTCK